MGRFGLLLLWVACAGCACGGPGPSRPCGRAPLPAPELVTGEAPFFFGQIIEVELEVPGDGACAGDPPPSVTRAAAEVTDGRNRLLDSVASAPRRVQLDWGGSVWRTTVAFQPTRPGAHHLIVTFEPSGQLAQRDVQVVVDRRGAPTRTAATPGADCDAAVFNARGSTLCRLSGGGAVLFRGSAEAARFVGAVQAVGEVFWEVSPPGYITRSIDLGAGPPALTHVSPFSGSGQFAFSPREEEVVWWNARAADRIGLADGGSMERLSRTDVAEDRYPDALAWAPDAGAALFGQPLKWARLELVPGTVQPNWHDSEALVAHEPDCLWVKSGSAVRRVPADPRVPEVAFTPPPGWAVRSDFALVGNYDSRPVFFPMLAEGMDFTRALVPVVDGEESWLEYFEALVGTGFVGASGGLLHARRAEEHYFWEL